MNVIGEISSRLKKYPDLAVEETSDSISVSPISGFTVWVTDNGDSWTVGFEGWHEEFDNSDEALNCFAWGLSKECRLKTIKRGGKAHKWIAQNFENEKWVDESTTGLIFYPFWRKPEVTYEQNAIIDS
jgi:hypothetical protein